MALKALLCSGDDEMPQHRNVLRAIHTLNSPKNYTCLLGGLSLIHTLRWRGAQGLIHQKLYHVPYYIDILLNRLGMFNLGIISIFFTLRSYFINLE
jgi:hypothetical protein